MPGKKPLRLDAYVRVSRVGDRDVESKSYITEDIQEDKIRQFMKLHDYEFGELHLDRNVSGGRLDRPGLNEAMRRIETGESDGLVVYNLSRFSRSLKNTVLLIERIRAHDAVFASVSEQFDLSTWQGRMVFNILQSIAEGERERQREVFIEATTRAVKRDLAIRSHRPFGYQYIEEQRETRPNGTVLTITPMDVHPVEGPMVRDLFKRRAEGWPLLRLSNWLHDSGVPTNTGKPWHPNKVRDILKRRIYLGEADNGRTFKEGAHPPLVDPVTFDAVQRIKGTRYSSKGRPKMLLTGLCRCASCRYTLNPINTPEGTSKERPRYTCSRRSAGRRDCPAPVTINAVGSKRHAGPGAGGHGGQDAAGLDEYVVEAMFERLYDLEAQAYGAGDGGLEELQDAANAARGRLDAHARDLELMDSLGRDAYRARAEELRDACDRAEGELNEAIRKAARPLIDRPVRQLREDWEAMTLEDRHELLAQVIQTIFVRRWADAADNGADGYGASPARVHIVWFDDPQVDIPRQGRRDYTPHPFVFPDDANVPGDVGVPTR